MNWQLDSFLALSEVFFVLNNSPSWAVGSQVLFRSPRTEPQWRPHTFAEKKSTGPFLSLASFFPLWFYLGSLGIGEIFPVHFLPETRLMKTRPKEAMNNSIFLTKRTTVTNHKVLSLPEADTMKLNPSGRLQGKFYPHSPTLLMTFHAVLPFTIHEIKFTWIHLSVGLLPCNQNQKMTSGLKRQPIMCCFEQK